MSETDFIALVFLALVSRIDLNAEGPVVIDEAVIQVKEYSPVLEPFTQRAVAEVALVCVLPLPLSPRPAQPSAPRT